jgi:hypothetical protein
MTAILLALCFGHLTQPAYAEKDVHALHALFAEARTREDSLLLRYRLYALTQDKQLIADIPSSLETATARELALLSALWGYRIQDVGLIHLILYGQRSLGLLNRAVRHDPAEPLVMLIEAQSLLFRPGIAGGDKRKALSRFRQLRERVEQVPACGLDVQEVDSWIWYTLEKLGAEEADSARATLLDADLPPLYREFVLSPP